MMPMISDVSDANVASFYRHPGTPHVVLLARARPGTNTHILLGKKQLSFGTHIAPHSNRSQMKLGTLSCTTVGPSCQ